MVLVSKERYLQDNQSIRLGNLASNLARISSRCQARSDRDLVESLLKESKFFIEWTAPELEIEIAAELVELQIQLACWQYSLVEIWNDAKQLQIVAQKAGLRSDRVLNLSGLLSLN
jgi:hypothetical protein